MAAASPDVCVGVVCSGASPDHLCVGTEVDGPVYLSVGLYLDAIMNDSLASILLAPPALQSMQNVIHSCACRKEPWPLAAEGFFLPVSVVCHRPSSPSAATGWRRRAHGGGDLACYIPPKRGTEHGAKIIGTPVFTLLLFRYTQGLCLAVIFSAFLACNLTFCGGT